MFIFLVDFKPKISKKKTSKKKRKKVLTTWPERAVRQECYVSGI